MNELITHMIFLMVGAVWTWGLLRTQAQPVEKALDEASAMNKMLIEIVKSLNTSRLAEQSETRAAMIAAMSVMPKSRRNGKVQDHPPPGLGEILQAEQDRRELNIRLRESLDAEPAE